MLTAFLIIFPIALFIINFWLLNLAINSTEDRIRRDYDFLTQRRIEQNNVLEVMEQRLSKLEDKI